MRPRILPCLMVASLRRICLAAALVLSVAAAQAVSISPVVIDLTPTHRVVSITFTNPGDRPVSYQTKTLAWTQADGIDHYRASDDLIVAPPIAEIAPGGAQIFRIALRGAATGREQAYRVVFEDVTSPTAVASSGEVALKVRVNHDLPVFVAISNQAQAQLRMARCADERAPGLECVRIENLGDHYAQVKSLTIECGAWRKTVPVNGRILADAWRQWILELPSNSSDAVKVSAVTSVGVIHADLSAQSR
jgi:fimbrial chaperone protein